MCRIFVLSLVLSIGVVNLQAQPSGSGLKGTWIECIGIDSADVLACSRPFATFYLDSTANFVMKDSLFCYPDHYAQKGKWVLRGDHLTIIFKGFSDPDGCSFSGYINSFSGLTWISKDLFYSVSIGTVEWPNERIFSVFKRIGP